MKHLFASLTFLGLIGCAGKAPPGVDPPEVDAGVDAPPEETGQRVTGKTLDYFTANSPMADSTVASDGIDPPLMATSVTGGDFALESVPIGSKVFFTVTHTDYRPTRNPPVAVDGMPVVADLHMIHTLDANRQYTTAGLLATQGVGKAIVIADLRLPDSTPLAGIPLTNVTLVDALDVPVPGIVGPFAMGVLDIDIAATDATTVNGRSRIAILDVPPGNHVLKVTYLDAQLATQTLSVPIGAVADGATLATTGGMGAPPGGAAITNPLFGMHIYPRLQRVTAGGLGCANCHTAAGPASSLPYDLTPTEVLAALTARPGAIDLATPALSLFLTAPLYEPPPVNHPNATFIDVNDLDYKLFLLWITQGALP